MKIHNLIPYIQQQFRYFWTGIWRDPRSTVKTRTLKTINLSIRSFLDRDLQAQSMSLTYSTVLALVPALALILAICRGFGLQDLIVSQIPTYFPTQAGNVNTALEFVDHYLTEASGGVFVGVGIVVLLWTLLSLLSNIEDAFNNIWDIKQSRSIYQKFTDYIAICLIVPILMICSSGVSIFMSTTLQEKLHLQILTPLVNVMMECMPVVLVWLAFTFSYFLIPNTKVKFKYAAIAGAICAIAFQILQLLFVNGQIYVSKYNAIYGSFSFLPLLLIWFQFSWLILLFGCVLTFSLQNVFAFNYLGNIKDISDNYMNKLTLAITAIVFKRFNNELPPLTRTQICKLYNIPVRIVGRICDALFDAKLIYYVKINNDQLGICPAIEADSLSVGMLFSRIFDSGEKNFIPGFDQAFESVSAQTDKWFSNALKSIQNIRVIDIPLPTPAEIQHNLEMEQKKASELYSGKFSDDSK